MPGRVPAILVTDIGTEMDDQWALAHLALSPGVNLLGVVTTHAPNLAHPRAETAAKAALEVLSQMRIAYPPPVVAGSSEPLADRQTPRPSEGVDFIIRSSQGYSPANRLRLLVIGAATEAASALLTDPTIAKRVEIIGMGFKNWPEGGDEWNVKNDIRAWQIILDSDVAVTIGDAAVCKQDLLMSTGRADAMLGNLGTPGRFLADLLINLVRANPGGVASVSGQRDSWPVWDEVTVAYVLGLAQSDMRLRPRLGDDFRFVIPSGADGRMAGWITHVDAESLWRDFAGLVAGAAAVKDNGGR